ncbi:MAG: radical SAM family heme chaperone HemW [Oligoflexia bacterium]|nr:radical SAM family heme chaperone HemW [Oligoflexia bacterium]
MAFGIYVHIPYCLQRCTYCDFATFEASQILSPNLYINHLKNEIRNRGTAVGPRAVDTIYFGGGTPSLLHPSLLGDILAEFSINGFTWNSQTEVTLEINPATLDETKIEAFTEAGFNRFSVGVQTFNDRLLKLCHRKHSAQDTHETLKLLESRKLNYSVDILFGLPTQTLGDLASDLNILDDYNPKHASPYCLTVPTGHPMNTGRAPDEEQAQMFDLIDEELSKRDFYRYEISNYAIRGFESRHNLLYWQNQEYWGVGLSSHSYLKKGSWGVRFWNSRSLSEYFEQIKEDFDPLKVSETQGELLTLNQAKTDFCHTSLRTSQGLNLREFARTFGGPLDSAQQQAIKRLQNQGLVTLEGEDLRLTRQGILISNQVFVEFAF